jgi:hypothetical protein
MISKRVLILAVALLVATSTGAMAQALVNVDDFVIGTLNISPGSVLDVGDYGVATVTPYTQVQGYIADGSIISTRATTDPSGLQLLVQVSGDDYSSYIGPSFHTHSVVTGDTLLQRTYYGDADFNGAVDLDDYGYIDAGYGSSGVGWILGDFDGNGQVDLDDYGYIDAAYGLPGSLVVANASHSVPGGGTSSVPEPSAIVLLVCSAVLGFVAYLRKR